MNPSDKANLQYKVAIKTYEEVGRGISTWAATEIRLIQIAAKLLGTTEEKAGLVLYSVNNFYTWVAIIDGLFDEENFPEAKKKWGDVVQDLKSQNDIRARLAHQSLYMDVYKSDDDKFSMVSGGLKPTAWDRRPKQKKMQPLSFQDIAKFSETVMVLHGKLIKVIHAIDSPSALPDKSAE